MNLVKMLLVLWSISALLAVGQVTQKQPSPVVVERAEKGGEGGHSGSDTSGVDNPNKIEGTFTLDDLISQAFKCTDKLANSFARQFMASNPKVIGVYRSAVASDGSPNFYEAPYVSGSSNASNSNTTSEELVLNGSVRYQIVAEDNLSSVVNESNSVWMGFGIMNTDFQAWFAQLNFSPILFEEFKKQNVYYRAPENFNFPTYKFVRLIPDPDKIVYNDRGAVISGIKYADVYVLPPSSDTFNLDCLITDDVYKCTKLEINAKKYAECLNQLKPN